MKCNPEHIAHITCVSQAIEHGLKECVYCDKNIVFKWVINLSFLPASLCVLKASQRHTVCLTQRLVDRRSLDHCWRWLSAFIHYRIKSLCIFFWWRPCFKVIMIHYFSGTHRSHLLSLSRIIQGVSLNSSNCKLGTVWTGVFKRGSKLISMNKSLSMQGFHRVIKFICWRPIQSRFLCRFILRSVVTCPVEVDDNIIVVNCCILTSIIESSIANCSCWSLNSRRKDSSFILVLSLVTKAIGHFLVVLLCHIPTWPRRRSPFSLGQSVHGRNRRLNERSTFILWGWISNPYTRKCIFGTLRRFMALFCDRAKLESSFSFTHCWIRSSKLFVPSWGCFYGDSRWTTYDRLNIGSFKDS